MPFCKEGPGERAGKRGNMNLAEIALILILIYLLVN